MLLSGSLCWEGRCRPVGLCFKRQEGKKGEMSQLSLFPLSDGNVGEASYEVQNFPKRH